jgi:cytochrome c-type biogenesis protein CcmE
VAEVGIDGVALAVAMQFYAIRRHKLHYGVTTSLRQGVEAGRGRIGGVVAAQQIALRPSKSRYIRPSHGKRLAGVLTQGP